MGRTVRRLEIGALTLSALCAALYAPCAAASEPGAAHPRAALVIGNAGYSAVNPLKNSANDAHDMCDALGELSYKVSCFVDLKDAREFKARVQDFVGSLAPKSSVLFYYAGHAVQLKGENYLVPTGARLRSEADVGRETISLNYILTQLSQAKHYLNVVMLDACRSNPWPEGQRTVINGLAPITAIPRGTMVLYATATNDFSDDGEGRNGTLTKNLLAAIKVPGLTVDDVFKRVSDGVQADSMAAVGHTQTPALYTNFTGEFCFAGCIDKVARAELEKMQRANEEQLKKARQEKAALEARNSEIEAKLASTETSMNCDKSVLSDYGQCFTARPDATLRAVSETLLQRGFTIEQSDAETGTVQAVRSVPNPKDQNLTDTVSATATVRAVPVTGHSVVTISATARTVQHQEWHEWTQVAIIPIPKQKRYQNIVKKEVNVTDPAFFRDLFAAIDMDLRGAAVEHSVGDLHAATLRADAAAAPSEADRAGEATSDPGAPNAAPNATPNATPAAAPTAVASVPSASAAPTLVPTSLPVAPGAQLPAQPGHQHHFGAPPEPTLRIVIEALVERGYVIESTDTALDLVRATRRLQDPKDERNSNDITLSASVTAEAGANGSRVQVMASEQKMVHRKPSKSSVASRFFGGADMPRSPADYQPQVVATRGITDAGFYRELFAGIEADMSGSATALSGHSQRVGAPVERTLPAVLDGLAQLGFSIDQTDKRIGFVTATRFVRDAKDAKVSIRMTATTYVRPDPADTSVVIVAASEQVMTNPYAPMMEQAFGRMPAAQRSAMGQMMAIGEVFGGYGNVVTREGEVSDASFYKEVFTMIERKVADSNSRPTPESSPSQEASPLQEASQLSNGSQPVADSQVQQAGRPAEATQIADASQPAEITQTQKTSQPPASDAR